MSNKNNDFIKAPVFGISEDELSTGSVNDNEVGTINGKKIKAHSITSDQIAAGAIGAVQLQAGAITAFKITVPNRVKGTTVVFSVGGANNDTLQWTSGVAYLMKMKYTPGDTMGDLQVVQVQQTISAGSYQFKSGDSAYYFYVEWAKDQDSDEPADSATLIMQKSTTYPSSDTAIVLAYAWYDPILGLAQFQALDTAGGGVKISGNSIIAGSITAQNIRAGTITADRLSFQAFDKSKDTLDSVADGSVYKRVKSVALSADGMVLLDQTIDGNYGKIYKTYISAGKLSLTYGVFGKLNNAVLDTDNPTSAGLYMTYYHLGFWNGSTWTVDIQSNGTAIFGIDGSSNYLKWDGSTLTVRGDIKANSVTTNISITSPYITLSGSGYIAGGKGSFTDTNNGFWLGYYNGNYTFNIGNSSQYLKWDGTTLTVRGDVQANSVVANVSITSPNITLNSAGYIAGGKSSFTDNTNNGFWIGYSSNNYVFIIGNSTQYLKWDGTTLTVRGDIQATSIVSGISITSPTITGATINGSAINGGTALFGTDGSANYLKWDGSTLTIAGNIVSSTITSPTITGGTLKTSASGERIEISSSNSINFYNTANNVIVTMNAPSGTGLSIQSTLGITLTSAGRTTIQSSGENINLIPGSGYYVTVQGPIYMSANQPIYFGGTNSSIYGSGGNLTVTVGMSINGSLYAGYGIQSNGTISLTSGYGIQFYSTSGKGGKFWYSNGNLYFTDENGNTHTISYT